MSIKRFFVNDNQGMKNILSGILLSIGVLACAQADKNMVDENCFEAIIKFVLENGWDAYLSKDDSLTPMVEYKNILVYVIPDYHTKQRENVQCYKQIIVYGPDAAPAYNRGPRFDIHKGEQGAYFEEGTINEKRIINEYMAILKEMITIKRITENMNLIVNKKQFENMVHFILNNGEEIMFSSLWGNSPSISYRDISIYLTPNPPYNMEYQEKMRIEVSHYKRMTVFYDAEGGSIFEMRLGEDGDVYIYANNYRNKILYENEIVSVAIPLLIEMTN